MARASPEPIWLRSPSGDKLSIVWPQGFTLKFKPEAVLYDENERVVAREGDEVVLTQVNVEDHAGTFDDPYFAAGFVFGNCYLFVPLDRR